LNKFGKEDKKKQTKPTRNKSLASSPTLALNILKEEKGNANFVQKIDYVLLDFYRIAR
jgi:hypothetical protein